MNRENIQRRILLNVNDLAREFQVRMEEVLVSGRRVGESAVGWGEIVKEMVG